MNFRRIYRIGWNTLRFVRPVLPAMPSPWRIAAIVVGMLLAVPLLIFLGTVAADLVVNGLIRGEPLLPRAAWLLRLDPEQFVNVKTLTLEARQTVRFRLVVYALASGAVIGPVTVLIWLRIVRWLQRINQEMREQLVDRLQALSLRYHNEARIGDMIYRFYQDSAMGVGLIGALFWEPAWNLIPVAFTLGLVALYDVWLALLLLSCFVGFCMATVYLSEPFRRFFRGSRETNAVLTSRIQESLSAIRVIKAYGVEDLEQRRFEAASGGAFEAATRARAGYALFGIAFIVVAGAVGLWLDYELTVRVVGQAAIPLGGFFLVQWFVWNAAAFFFVRGRMAAAGSSVLGLTRIWLRAQDMIVGMDRLFELLEKNPEVDDAPGAVPFEGVERQMAFRGVHFGYDPERPVLHDVSLAFPAGSITAIVGPTGSGKSTLLYLLLRLFDPQRGSIEIDGRDLREFDVATLRSRISIALQQNQLFGMSVRDNIRYAVPSATDRDVREAARVACADAFIDSLPQGYDTLLGERGARISTGQRQRLGIARAVLKDAPVLILDEPTAALDAETELEVLDRLARWGRDRVIFMVTHRLSTIRQADQIVYLRDGRVVEVGTHAELVACPQGAYRAFVELESSGLGDRPAEEPDDVDSVYGAAL